MGRPYFSYDSEFVLDYWSKNEVTDDLWETINKIGWWLHRRQGFFNFGWIVNIKRKSDHQSYKQIETKWKHPFKIQDPKKMENLMKTESSYEDLFGFESEKKDFGLLLAFKNVVILATNVRVIGKPSLKEIKSYEKELEEISCENGLKFKTINGKDARFILQHGQHLYTFYKEQKMSKENIDNFLEKTRKIIKEIPLYW